MLIAFSPLSSQADCRFVNTEESCIHELLGESCSHELLGYTDLVRTDCNVRSPVAQ